MEATTYQSDELDPFAQSRALRWLFLARGMLLATGFWFLFVGIARHLVPTSFWTGLGRLFLHHLLGAALGEELGKLCAAAAVVVCFRYRKLRQVFPVAAFVCGAIMGLNENYLYILLAPSETSLIAQFGVIRMLTSLWQ
ncbi:MAG: hypothetical protein MHM6MM_004216 [Cercozoa sp. M6MM]